jgi:hypothetical protein
MLKNILFPSSGSKSKLTLPPALRRYIHIHVYVNLKSSRLLVGAVVSGTAYHWPCHTEVAVFAESCFLWWIASTNLTHCLKLYRLEAVNPEILLNNIVTYRPIARQRLSKQIPVGANARNSRISTARQRISKHTSITIEDVFSAWSMQSG